MTAKYFALLTNVGAAKLANATALGNQLAITVMAVGDANGAEPVPEPSQTQLVHECHRALVNSLRVDPNSPSQVIAEQVLTETVGGWWIREIGLYDADGDLIAVGNCPPSYKPLMAEGSGREQIIRMILIVSSSDAVELKIDPSVVLATREYVDESIEAHAKTRNHPDASTTAKGLVRLSSATNSTSETLAATPKAVKAAYDLASGKLSSVPDATTTAKGIVQLSSATNSTSETLAATPKAVKVVQDAVSALDKLAVKTVNTKSPDANGNVKLGTAADANLGKDLPGQVLTVGNYGLANTLTALDSTDLDTLQTFGFYVVRNSVNGPVGSNPGTVFLKVITWQSGNGASGYRVIQEVIGYGASASTGNRVWRRTWTGTIWTGWVEFYSETYKPTAVDIAALPLIGGKMTGEIQSTSANALRMIQGGYGVILRMDANGFYILQTNKNDPNGNYNANRSVTIANDTGAVSIGTQLTVTNADFINKVGYTTYTGGDGHNHAQVGGLRLEVDGSQLAELYYNVDVTGKNAEVALHNKYGTTDSYLSLRNDGVLSLVGSSPQLYLGSSRVGSDGNVFGAAYGNDWLTNWVKSYTFNGNNHPTQSSVSGNQWWYKDLSTGMIFQGGYTEGQNADARDRIALNISVPNRLLYVSTIIKNYAQGYDTTYNPQVGDLAGERDGFWWFHGAQERVIYWMAVGY